MPQILIYIIPCHGVFLSSFLLFRSERPPGNNFLLGLMLFSLSCLSALQLYQSLNGSYFRHHASFYILNELLVSPFLFLYTFSLFHTASKSKILLYMLFLMIILPLLFWVNWFDFPVRKIIIIVLCLMNGVYLLTMVLPLKDSLKRISGKHFQIVGSGCPWICMLNLLVLSSLSTSILWYATCPERMAHLAQLSKGLVIYYTYNKILGKAVFTGKIL